MFINAKARFDRTDKEHSRDIKMVILILLGFVFPNDFSLTSINPRRNAHIKKPIASPYPLAAIV